jgi:hypothetical protein
MYRSAGLGEVVDVNAVVDWSVKSLAVPLEARICLQVDESSTGEAVASFGHFVNPPGGRQMVLLRTLRRVRCGRIAVAELGLPGVVLHSYRLAVEVAAEAAVRSMSAFEMWEATAEHQHDSAYACRMNTYWSWKLGLAARHSSIDTRIVCGCSRLLSLGSIL